MAELTQEVLDLLAVAAQWSHKDDWDVSAIYVGTLRELAQKLAAGTDPYLLARHAKHVGIRCCALYVKPRVRA